MPSVQLWYTYRSIHTINGAMQRQVVLPPGAPAAAVAALRAAVARVNDDKEHAEESMKTMGFVPEWMTGTDTNAAVRTAITLPPETRAFIADYVKRAVK